MRAPARADARPDSRLTPGRGTALREGRRARVRQDPSGAGPRPDARGAAGTAAPPGQGSGPATGRISERRGRGAPAGTSPDAMLLRPPSPGRPAAPRFRAATVATALTSPAAARP